MKWNKNSILLLVLLVINTIIFIIAALGFPIRFKENDDIMMCLIANGGYSGSPDCHLVFINAIYGTLLKWLYLLIPTIEWYTISFSIVHIISISCIIYLIVKKQDQNIYIKLVWFLFVYVIWIRMIATMQFTTTAGIAVIAGCWLMCKGTNLYNIVGGILIIIASLIRFQVAGLVVLLFIPLFIYQFNFSYKKYLPLIIIGSFIIILKFADYGFYQSPEWKYYKQYNTIRGQLNDNPNADSDYVYNQLPEGVTKTDYEMLLQFVGDPSVIDLEAIDEINEKIKLTTLKNKIQHLGSLKLYMSVFLILTCLTMLLLINSNKKDKVYILLSFLLFCGIAIGIAMNGTLKNRVFLCMLLSLLLVYYHITSFEMKHKYILFFIVGLVLLLNGKYIKQIYKAKNQIEHKLEAWNEITMLLKLMPNNNSYIVPIGTDMYIEAISPFNVIIPNCNTLCLGWLTAIPFNNNKLNSHIDLVKRDDIYILTDVNNDSLSSLHAVILNNYGINTFEHVIVVGNNYKIVKMMH